MIFFLKGFCFSSPSRSLLQGPPHWSLLLLQHGCDLYIRVTPKEETQTTVLRAEDRRQRRRQAKPTPGTGTLLFQKCLRGGLSTLRVRPRAGKPHCAIHQGTWGKSFPPRQSLSFSTWKAKERDEPPSGTLPVPKSSAMCQRGSRSHYSRS